MLDPDVEIVVRQAMREQGISFKQALNQAIRAGASSTAGSGEPFRQRSFNMGRPRVDLVKALSLTSELDDQPLARLYRSS